MYLDSVQDLDFIFGIRIKNMYFDQIVLIEKPAATNKQTMLHLIGLKYLWKSELTYLEINPDLRSKSDSVDLQIVLNLIFIFDDKDVKLTWMRRVESIRLFS